MIQCKTCNEFHPEDHYHKSSRECKACRNIRARRNYKERMKDPEAKAKKREQSKAAKNRLKEKLVKYHGNQCYDCKGSFHSSVYDFHHLDPSAKDFSVAKSSNYEKALEESKKCVMLCANCHRIRHWEEGTEHEGIN